MAGVVVIDWQSVAISVAKFAKQQELRSFGNMMLEAAEEEMLRLLLVTGFLWLCMPACYHWKG